MRQNLYQRPQDVKEAAYKGLVRPVLEYSSCGLNTQGVVLQEEIEKVQNRAARLVTSNYCFETGSMTGILEKIRLEEKEERQYTYVHRSKECRQHSNGWPYPLN